MHKSSQIAQCIVFGKKNFMLRLAIRCSITRYYIPQHESNVFQVWNYQYLGKM